MSKFSQFQNNVFADFYFERLGLRNAKQQLIVDMRRSNKIDPDCPSCKKGVEVYYATPNQEYWYEPGIYGNYEKQLQLVNGRAHFKKGNFGIWWDGEEKWTIGLEGNKGTNTGCACITRDVFCLHSVKEMDWELYWGDTGDWEKARKDLAIRISTKRGKNIFHGYNNLEYVIEYF